MLKGLLIAAVALLAANAVIGIWQISVLEDVSHKSGGGAVEVENWPDSLNVQVKNDEPLAVEVHPEMSKALIDPKTFQTLIPSEPVPLPVIVKNDSMDPVHVISLP